MEAAPYDESGVLLILTQITRYGGIPAMSPTSPAPSLPLTSARVIVSDVIPDFVLCSAPSVPQPVFTITEMAPIRAFSWFKAPTSAYTFKTLIRH